MPGPAKLPKRKPKPHTSGASTPLTPQTKTNKTDRKTTPVTKAGKRTIKTTLPTKPKIPTTPTTPTTKRTKKPSGRAATHDWSSIRREYIRGDDNVTLKSLSLADDAPAEGSIERRAMNEGWTQQRQDFRREVDLKLRSIDVDMKTEVRRRHAGVGKGMVNIGAIALKALGDGLSAHHESASRLLEEVAVKLARGAKPEDPEIRNLLSRAVDARTYATLETVDIIRFIRYGSDLERKALGMEELNINFRNIQSPEDLDKLSEEQLWQLMGQLPPDDDDEDF